MASTSNYDHEPSMASKAMLEVEATSGTRYSIGINPFEDSTVGHLKRRLRQRDWEATNSDETEILLSDPDGQKLDDNTSLRELMRRYMHPGNGRASGVLRIYYQLQKYPPYVELVRQRGMKYGKFAMITIDLFIVIVAALFMAAMSQAAFNLPQAWSNQLKIADPVPITFQTFAVLVTATCLGCMRGAATQLVYIAFIAIGAPFGAEATGGPNTVVRSGSAGFFWGFVVAAALMGYLAERGWDRQWKWTVLSMCLGEIVLYVIGLIYLPFGIAMADNISPAAAVCGYGHGCVGNTLWFGLVPFLPGEVVKIAMAWLALPIGWKLLGYQASQREVLLSLRNEDDVDFNDLTSSSDRLEAAQ